ncbi:flagellar hook-associated protein FlgL, partial [Bacillus licheniformis]|uniref:flagellin n=1 Tax=Bacillus licheniformis TaxID=1402 RepID=UPI000F9ACF06
KDVKQFGQPFIIGLLENISKNLTNKDQVEIKKDITRVKDVLDNVLKVTAEFGAKTNRMKLTKNKIEDSVFNLKSLMSDNEDVSLAEAMTKLLTEENVYRASLGVTGRIVQPSLMDFLR